MAPILVETHFKGRQPAVAELFFHMCIMEGYRNADVTEAGLDRVERAPAGHLVVAQRPLVIDRDSHVLLVTPQDRSGWCVAYPSSPQLGERLVDMLAEPCPLEDGSTWQRHLRVEGAMHGFVNEPEGSWGWIVLRGEERSELSRREAADAPAGKDVNGAFAAHGRLFGQVYLETVLNRLVGGAPGTDRNAHRLLLARRGRPSRA